MVFYNPEVIALPGGWLGPRPVAVVFVGPCWRLFFPSSISLQRLPRKNPLEDCGRIGGMLTAARLGGGVAVSPPTPNPGPAAGILALKGALVQFSPCWDFQRPVSLTGLADL